MTQSSNQDQRRKPRAEGLMLAARYLESVGRSQSGLRFLEMASEQRDTPALQKASFWAALKAGHFEVADSVLAALEYQRSASGADCQNTLDRMRQAGKAGPDRRSQRICYVLTGSLPWMQTGYAMRSQALLQALARQGADIYCLTRPGFPADRPGLDRNAQYPAFSRVGEVTYHHIETPSRNYLKRYAYLEAAAGAMVKALAPLEPGVVMAASDFNNALPALLAAREMGVPFIYDVRGFWELSRIAKDAEHENHPDFATALALESLTARHADRIVTLTDAMRGELVRRGADPKRIVLVPNACDPAQHVPRARDSGLAQRLGVPRDMPVIGYVGSFNAYEGLDDLVRACGRLRRRGLAFRLLLVGKSAGQAGKPPYEATLEEVARSEGISDWLIMPGQVPPEEVGSWYSLIDVAPFPRKALAVTKLVSPLKPLEALSMAKTVVASDLAPLAEMIEDGQTGLLVAHDNLASLEAALAKALADPALRQRLGKAGRQWVLAERTWDKVTRAIREIVEDTCGTGAHDRV